jgi:flagellar basal body rod protein FlgC
MNRFELLDAAASGMAAQRAALDVAARNVAAAEAAGPKGSYQRAVPTFAVVTGDGGTDGDVRVEFTGTRTERGVNVDVLQEMLAVMNASRAYEADTSLFDTGKRLTQQTLDLEH